MVVMVLWMGGWVGQWVLCWGSEKDWDAVSRWVMGNVLLGRAATAQPSGANQPACLALAPGPWPSAAPYTPAPPQDPKAQRSLIPCALRLLALEQCIAKDALQGAGAAMSEDDWDQWE